MNEFYNIIAYNTLGEVQEVEATDDSWIATETCLDLWGRHAGEYGDRPAALGQRTF